MNILIIEDEFQIADAISRLFEKNNFIVQIALDGETGFNHATSKIYDLIILDIMIPKINGFDLIPKIRAEGINVPILCLTARHALNDEIIGLELGADDYLTKPFSFQKLLVRAKALLRRGDLINPTIYNFHDLSLNLDDCNLSCNDQVIKLSSKEFHLMSLLLKRKDGYVSKEEIMDKIWGYDSIGEYNTVEVYISFLRKKLQSLGSNVLIKVNRNIGYKLEVDNK